MRPKSALCYSIIISKSRSYIKAGLIHLIFDLGACATTSMCLRAMTMEGHTIESRQTIPVFPALHGHSSFAIEFKLLDVLVLRSRSNTSGPTYSSFLNQRIHPVCICMILRCGCVVYG
jgi:hypothetical protein